MKILFLAYRKRTLCFGMLYIIVLLKLKVRIDLTFARGGSMFSYISSTNLYSLSQTHGTVFAKSVHMCNCQFWHQIYLHVMHVREVLPYIFVQIHRYGLSNEVHYEYLPSVLVIYFAEKLFSSCTLMMKLNTSAWKLV